MSIAILPETTTILNFLYLTDQKDRNVINQSVSIQI